MLTDTSLSPQNPSATNAGSATATPVAKAAPGPVDEGEFHLTIKKLEMPVRPRGVLAE